MEFTTLTPIISFPIVNIGIISSKEIFHSIATFWLSLNPNITINNSYHKIFWLTTKPVQINIYIIDEDNIHNLLVDFNALVTINQLPAIINTNGKLRKYISDSQVAKYLIVNDTNTNNQDNSNQIIDLGELIDWTVVYSDNETVLKENLGKITLELYNLASGSFSHKSNQLINNSSVSILEDIYYRLGTDTNDDCTCIGSCDYLMAITYFCNCLIN